jgi:hypothetical protein
MKSILTIAKSCWLATAVLALVSCGGGGSGGSMPPSITAAATDFVLPNVISAVPPQD